MNRNWERKLGKEIGKGNWERMEEGMGEKNERAKTLHLHSSFFFASKKKGRLIGFSTFPLFFHSFN